MARNQIRRRLCADEEEEEEERLRQIFFVFSFVPEGVKTVRKTHVQKYRSISFVSPMMSLSTTTNTSYSRTKFLKVSLSTTHHTHTSTLTHRLCYARVFPRFLKSDDDDDDDEDDVRASRIRVGRQSALSRRWEWKKKNRARDERETKRGKCEYLFSRSSFEDDESERASTTLAKRMHGNCVQ